MIVLDQYLAFSLLQDKFTGDVHCILPHSKILINKFRILGNTLNIIPINYNLILVTITFKSI